MYIYVYTYEKMREIRSVVNRFTFLILASVPPLENIWEEWGKDSLFVLGLRATTSRIPGMHFLH